jgi:hypothetical protein
VLRPKAAGRQAHFYTLVSRDTDEQEFTHHGYPRKAGHLVTSMT